MHSIQGRLTRPSAISDLIAEATAGWSSVTNLHQKNHLNTEFAAASWEFRIANSTRPLTMFARSFARPVLAHTRRARIGVSWRAYSQAVGPLVYDLHEPAKPRFDEKTEPILFLHGLFGSKKNNRGISK